MRRVRIILIIGFICVPIVIVCITIFGIIYKVDESKKYATGSDYHVSLNDFENEIYPKLKNELLFGFETNDLMVDLTDEKKGKNGFYSFDLEGDFFKSYVYFSVYDDSCLFTIETNFFVENLSDGVMEYVKKYDIAITNFGQKYFYDLWDTSSIFLDIYYGSNDTSKIIHFDSLYGEIGISYNERTDSDMIEKYGLFNIKIRFLLTNC